MVLFLAPLVIGLNLLIAPPVLAEDGDLPAQEREKIEKLITHVKGLKDAVFVRNGVEYDAATAARFLQGKWDASAPEIKTARQFIEKAATASSTTGKPYLIRFKKAESSKEVKSGDYLLEQLKMLEQR